jgi:hypothetical protein
VRARGAGVSAWGRGCCLASAAAGAAGAAARRGRRSLWLCRRPSAGRPPPATPPAGVRHKQTYAQLAAAQPLLPGDALAQLLAQVIAAKRQSGLPGAAVGATPSPWALCM